MSARLRGVLAVIWGATTGIAPHVLHHAGPLAGAALLAGAGGQLLFGAIALALSIPFAVRVYRRFGTWVAPAVLLAVMTAAFLLSTLVIGPAITGTNAQSNDQPGVTRPTDHRHGH